MVMVRSSGRHRTAGTGHGHKLVVLVQSAAVAAIQQRRRLRTRAGRWRRGDHTPRWKTAQRAVGAVHHTVGRPPAASRGERVVEVMVDVVGVTRDGRRQRRLGSIGLHPFDHDDLSFGLTLSRNLFYLH